MIKEHLRMAQLFKEWVQQSKQFELMAPVHFGLVCFRLNDGGDESHLRDVNKNLMEKLNATGKLYLTHTLLKGKYVLRFAIGQRTTQEVHIRQAWDLILQCK